MFTLIWFNVIFYSKYTVPPKLSGQGFTVVASVRVEPVEVVLRMIVRAALMVLMSCTWDPGGTSRVLSVPTVVIGMTNVVAMLGAIVGDFKPFVSMAILLHDPLVYGCSFSTVRKSLFHLCLLLEP